MVGSGPSSLPAVDVDSAPGAKSANFVGGAAAVDASVGASGDSSPPTKATSQGTTRRSPQPSPAPPRPPDAFDRVFGGGYRTVGGIIEARAVLAHP
jgi:hypothetical protein